MPEQRQADGKAEEPQDPEQLGAHEHAGEGHHGMKANLAAHDFRFNDIADDRYGVRLPMDYKGGVPPRMLMVDVPEAEYIVFEHGPFDYEQENRSVEEQIEKAMAAFDFTGTGYCYDTAPGRIIYMYFNPEQFFNYIRPVRK